MIPTAAERTALAWERSALGPLAAALLLMAKRIQPTGGLVPLVAAYVVLALALSWLARRRKRHIGAPEIGSERVVTVPAAGREVFGTALATTAIALGTAALIAVHA